MSRKPTCTEIAENHFLWITHIDSDQNMTEAEFDSLSTEEKVDMIHEMFPTDCNCENEEEE